MVNNTRDHWGFGHCPRIPNDGQNRKPSNLAYLSYQCVRYTRLSLLSYFVVLLSHSRKLSRDYFEQGHNQVVCTILFYDE
jgi:hypothetical protein